jgi:hypothetical protein
VLDIGFETSEGYSTGNLFGQNSWAGDDDGRIKIFNSLANSGTQCLGLNGSNPGSVIEDYLSFDSVSGEFTWEFSIRDQGYYNGSNNFIRLADSGNDEYATYLYIDGKGYNGLSINYVTQSGMVELKSYDDHLWHDIKIVGNTTDDTFDFYFDTDPVILDKPFYNDVSDIASLNVGSDTYAGGAYSIYVDDVKLTSTVPVPGAAWLLGSGLISLIGFRNKYRGGR